MLGSVFISGCFLETCTSLSKYCCFWTQMDPKLSRSPEYNCSNLKGKERERGKFHSQTQSWKTHFKFNLKMSREESLKHGCFALFLASSINKQCKLPLLTWLSVEIHIQSTPVIQTWDVRRIFTFCYNIYYFLSSNSNPTKSYVEKEL